MSVKVSNTNVVCAEVLLTFQLKKCLILKHPVTLTYNEGHQAYNSFVDWCKGYRPQQVSYKLFSCFQRKVSYKELILT